PWANSGGTPMARSTGDGSSDPDEHAAPATKQHHPAKRQPAAVAMTPTGTNWTNGFGMTPNLLPRMFLLPSLKQPLKMMISKATPLNVR
ncbi:MAG: hypothetical protein ACK5L2_00815, partial [Planctomyces sp.]